MSGKTIATQSAGITWELARAAESQALPCPSDCILTRSQGTYRCMGSRKNGSGSVPNTSVVSYRPHENCPATNLGNRSFIRSFLTTTEH